MTSPLFFQDIANAAVGRRGTKTKRNGRLQLFPLSLSVASVFSKSLASSRKSPATCRVSFEHATSLSSCIALTSEDVNAVPFPSSITTSMDSESDLESRPHKVRRCSEPGNDAPTSSQSDQHKRRRSAPSVSRRHSLLAPTLADTCRTRPRSSSFSHSRQINVRETADLRFIAMIRRTVLCSSIASSGWMDVDDTFGDLRRQDSILVERLEKYLLRRGYRDMYLEGEPTRASVLYNIADDCVTQVDDACISPALERVIRHCPKTTPSTSQAVAALILRHRNRAKLRQQRSGNNHVLISSPLARHSFD